MSNSPLMVQTLQNAHHVSFTENRILDESSIDVIYREISALVSKNRRIKLILDFGTVDYISSAVLSKLVTLDREVKDVRGRMFLVNLKPATFEIFKITKLDSVLQIKKNTQEALNLLV